MAAVSAAVSNTIVEVTKEAPISTSGANYLTAPSSTSPKARNIELNVGGGPAVMHASIKINVSGQANQSLDQASLPTLDSARGVIIAGPPEGLERSGSFGASIGAKKKFPPMPPGFGSNEER